MDFKRELHIFTETLTFKCILTLDQWYTVRLCLLLWKTKQNRLYSSGYCRTIKHVKKAMC